MKRNISIAIAILIASICAVSAYGKTYDLRCENMTEPLGIDSAIPHFSWKNDKRQESYRIQLAASSSDLLSGNLIWDSGTVSSDASVMVPYSGPALSSRQLCWWRVAVNGTWSEPQRFSIGIIGDDAMQGEYIGAFIGTGNSPIVYRTFKIKDPSKTTFLHVNSLGYHEVYVNGESISTTVLNPAVSQLDKRSLIVTYDITPYLRKGSNDIAIWTGAGWYRKDQFKAEHDGPLVKACVDVLDKNGWDTILCTGTDWKAAKSGYVDMGSWTSGNFGGEQVSPASVPEGMTAAQLDRCGSVNAGQFKVSIAEATPQMCPANVLKEVVPAISVEPLGGGRWLVDMGKAMNAQLELRVEGQKAGDRISISYTDTAQSRGDAQTFGSDELICSGVPGKDVFRSKFNHHVFRYVLLEGVAEMPKLQNILAHRFGSIDRRGGSFHSSDPDLDRIHEMLTYTMDNLVFSGYMVDCASIERLGYGGDGNASALSLQTIADISPLYMNWLQAWIDTTGEDGHVRHTAPSPVGAGGGPYWCSFIVQAPWRVYMSYGDDRLLGRCYDSMLRWISYVKAYSKDGLLGRWEEDARRGWFLGDWLAPRPTDVMMDESVYLVSNCAVSQSFADLVQIAELLGKDDDAAKFAADKAELDRKIHERFYNPETGLYGTGSQLDMIYPMLVGVTPENLVEKVTEKLLERVEKEFDGHLGVGLVGVPVLAEWAARTGHADLVYGMLKKRSYPGYLYMIDNGATATWEDWDNPRSQLHNCFNGIVSWYYQALGGIIPDEPGYKHVTIRPQYPEGLDWVRVSQDTPYGKITVSWERKDGEIDLKVDVPAGITADIIRP